MAVSLNTGNYLVGDIISRFTAVNNLFTLCYSRARKKNNKIDEALNTALSDDVQEMMDTSIN
jgi:hypothetical protein